jgi:uncharacterized OB-fold protein
MSTDKETLEAALRTFVGGEIGVPAEGPDPVNEAMIRHWCDALDDRNPVYTDAAAARAAGHAGVVAPPSMMQTWVLPGVPMAKPETMRVDKQTELHALLSAHGYTGVVATNCEQGYTRYLRPGDRVATTTVIESISEEKATALGIGYFINTREIFRDQDGAEIGWQTFRVLKFKPAQAPQAATAAATPATPRRMRPPLGHDNQWWWDGIARGELLIQKCSSCGTLRHPPRPMCGQCQSIAWEGQAAAGRGTVYSFTTMHHPKIPGFEYPLVCALIELAEGTRLLSNVVECPPETVRIGMPVELVMTAVDDEMTLPLFRPVAA